MCCPQAIIWPHHPKHCKHSSHVKAPCLRSLSDWTCLKFKKKKLSHVLKLVLCSKSWSVVLRQSFHGGYKCIEKAQNGRLLLSCVSYACFLKLSTLNMFQVYNAQRVSSYHLTKSHTHHSEAVAWLWFGRKADTLYRGAVPPRPPSQAPLVHTLSHMMPTLLPLHGPHQLLFCLIL